MRLAVEEVEERPRLKAVPTDTIPLAEPTPQETPSTPSEPTDPQPEPYRADTLEMMATAFGALGMALSARAILLLSVVGAFILAVLAMMSPTTVKLGVLAVYAVLVVIPCVVLEIRKRQ